MSVELTNVEKVPVTTQISNHLHSPMSTSEKNLATATAIISTVGGSLALVAGVHSMGAAAATLAGVSLALPPIALIVAGVAVILFAVYLFARVACITDLETFIQVATKQDRIAMQDAHSKHIEARKAHNSVQESVYEATQVKANCSAAFDNSRRHVVACKEAYQKTPEKQTPHIERHDLNKLLLEKAKANLQEIENKKLQLKADYNTTLKHYTLHCTQLEHAIEAAKTQYMNM